MPRGVVQTLYSEHTRQQDGKPCASAASIQASDLTSPTPDTVNTFSRATIFGDSLCRLYMRKNLLFWLMSCLYAPSSLPELSKTSCAPSEGDAAHKVH